MFNQWPHQQKYQIGQAVNPYKQQLADHQALAAHVVHYMHSAQMLF